MVDAAHATPEILLDDERGRGIPAVVRYGPYVFVAGSDGHRRLDDERIDPALADRALEQCRNSYGRVARRLEAVGLGEDGAVWIQNFTSGQHWRLERMGLWPEYFGEENHLRAVSFGAQSRMHGINMLTSIVMAIDPSIERHIAVASPGRGRASRCTRVGDLTFVIGVRGYEDVVTKAAIAEEVPGAFEAQQTTCFDNLASHLGHAGGNLGDFVRVDATLRAARFVAPYEDGVRRRFDGRIPFASYAIGTPLGGHGEMEIGGVAAAPGVAKTVRWCPWDATRVDSATTAGLTFVRNVSGIIDETTGAVKPELFGDQTAQVKQVVANLSALLAAAGTSLDRCLRLDVFVRDIYAEDDIIDALHGAFGGVMPALSFIGSEPREGAEIEITAIAAA